MTYLNEIKNILVKAQGKPVPTFVLAKVTHRFSQPIRVMRKKGANITTNCLGHNIDGKIMYVYTLHNWQDFENKKLVENKHKKKKSFLARLFG